jgi:hypothetical protein
MQSNSAETNEQQIFTNMKPFLSKIGRLEGKNKQDTRHISDELLSSLAQFTIDIADKDEDEKDVKTGLTQNYVTVTIPIGTRLFRTYKDTHF